MIKKNTNLQKNNQLRYCIELSYAGTNYCGWQRQPREVGVQQILEEKMSLIFRQPTTVVGCGRTDTGVHASQYFAHFDYPFDLPPNAIYRLNQLLPTDIATKNIFAVAPDFHARFDARLRSYTYFLEKNKNPFLPVGTFQFPLLETLDCAQMQAAAKLLLNYNDFTTFCKTNADNQTMRCEITRSEWHFEKDKMTYHISADRFLRGMVRLIVGACMSAGEGKISLEDLKLAMENRVPLVRARSVAAAGLYLSEVIYDF